MTNVRGNFVEGYATVLESMVRCTGVRAECLATSPATEPTELPKADFAHAADQLADVLGNRRSPGSSVPAFFQVQKNRKRLRCQPTTVSGFDEDGSGAPVGPDVRQPRLEKSVRGSKSGTVGNGASEDVDLVTEGNDLDLESGPGFHDRAGEQSKEDIGHAILGTSGSVSEGQSTARSEFLVGTAELRG